MHINFNRQFRGPEKANFLALTSSRYQEKRMSDHAKEAIEYVKSKDRSYLKVYP